MNFKYITVKLTTIPHQFSIEVDSITVMKDGRLNVQILFPGAGLLIEMNVVSSWLLYWYVEQSSQCSCIDMVTKTEVCDQRVTVLDTRESFQRTSGEKSTFQITIVIGYTSGTIERETILAPRTFLGGAIVYRFSLNNNFLKGFVLQNLILSLFFKIIQ